MIPNRQLLRNKQKAYIIGGGIASLATAVFLIKDGKIPGKNITIYEESSKEGNELGGSLDGQGSQNKGYIIRGGRMLNFETFECMWELLKTIPSLENPKQSIYQDIINFNKTFRTNSRARLININRKKVNVKKLGLSNKDRLRILKLKYINENKLNYKTIKDYFTPQFFKTNFWHMWSTMFAFHSEHSLIEFKRYMKRFFHEFYRLHTLAGVRRTKYNQYESIILPIIKWLESKNVNFQPKTIISNIKFKTQNQKHHPTQIEYKTKNQNKKQIQQIKEHDLVFFTNGSMTNSSTLGTHTSPPKIQKPTPSSFELWGKISKNKKDFGNPQIFSNNINKTKWESFTVTLKDPTLLKLIVNFCKNKPGTGGLVTFKDSNWLLSIVVPYQPHFQNQPQNIKVFWGYGFWPDKKGNFINKTMAECSGEEILYELCKHLQFDKHIPLILKTSNCIPCMMPYITSQFMPRKKTDRPKVIPNSSKNFAFIGQFCEIPNDVVFTVEYSIRSAQIAVYSLLKIKKPIPKIYQGDKNPIILLKSLKTLFN